MTSLTKRPVLGCTFWIELGSSSWLAVRGSRGDDELSVLGQKDFYQFSLKEARGRALLDPGRTL